jgi:hypothetical protein
MAFSASSNPFAGLIPPFLRGRPGTPPLRGGGARPDPDPEEQSRREQAEILAHFQPTQGEIDLVRFVERRYDAAKRAKDPYLQTWAECLAFYVGDHYRTWEPYRRQLVRNDSVPSWRVRLKDQQIKMLANTIAAKRARARHITFGQPNNPLDPQDVEAAKLATRFLRHCDRITSRDRKRLQLELLSTIYGTAFVLPYWDPLAATQVAFEEPNPRFGQVPDAPQMLVRGQEAWIGDVQWEVLDVWRVFPQPVQWWEDVSWAVVARVRTLEWVRTRFPERGILVRPDNLETDLFAAMERDAAAPAGGGVPLSVGGTADSPDDSVRVLEYYEAKSKRYPRGRFVVVANGVQLWAEQSLPHPKARFPLIPYYGMWIPGRLWGSGWVEDLIDQQRQLNRSESQAVENQAFTSRPKWGVARESKIEEDALHSGPGEVVEYNQQGGPPVPLSPPPTPAEILEQPDRIVERMQRIAGIHEASTGATPTGLSSGVAIDLAQQADESRLAIPTTFAGDSLKQLDQLLLEYAQELYTVPRLIRTLGRNVEAGAVAFMGSDLYGNTEVGLEEGEGVSDSIAAKRQRLLDYHNAGLLSPQMPIQFQIRVFTLMNEMDVVSMLQEEQAEQQRQAEEQAALGQEALAAQEEAEHAAALEGEAQETGQLLGHQIAAQRDAAGLPLPEVPMMPMPGAPQ